MSRDPYTNPGGNTSFLPDYRVNSVAKLRLAGTVWNS